MKKIYAFILMIFGAIGWVACDDDCDQFHIDSDLMGFPVVMKGSFPVGTLNPAIGDSIVFAPQLLDTTGVTYAWNVNGQLVSTDSVFVFKIDGPSRAEVICTLQNPQGRVTLEADILSKHDFSKGFWVVRQQELAFYDTDAEKLYEDCYASLNAGNRITKEGYIMPVFIGEKLYLPISNNVTNVNHLVVTDANTLYHEHDVNLSSGISNFIPLNDQEVLVSADGLTRLNLKSLTTTKLFYQYFWSCYNGIAYHENFLVNSTYGDLTKIGCFKVNDLLSASENQRPAMTELDVYQNGKFNFVQAKDGNVYTIACDEAGRDYYLAKIAADLTITKVPLTFKPAKPMYYSGATIGMVASANENVLYIPSAEGKIYKYVLGDESSLNQPFINFVPEDMEICASLQLDPSTNELLVCYSEEIEWREYVGKVIRFDVSGKVVQTIECGEGDLQGILLKK